MSKIVQLAGAIRTIADTYIGLARELTVDTSNWNLRLHDGATEGGHTFLNLTNADARYQAKSPELSGFIELEPQERGVLVRVGPAEYRLRQIDVVTAGLTITYADGFANNPLIGLAPTITSDHAWTGAHSFAQAIQANLIGDVLGNLTGDVLGDVTGNLTGNAAGNHTGTFTGSVNVSAGTITFADDQIPLSAVNGAAEAISAVEFPAGGIIMWSGSVESIPTGWRLCDGTNGTPNLQDKFIVGAGLTHAVAAIGGALTHTHGVTVDSDGAHFHQITGAATAASVTGVAANVATAQVENEQSQETVVSTVGITDPGHLHTLSGNTDSNGTHSHTAATGATNHLPPYYALAFIMKE